MKCHVLTHSRTTVPRRSGDGLGWVVCLCLSVSHAALQDHQSPRLITAAPPPTAQRWSVVLMSCPRTAASTFWKKFRSCASRAFISARLCSPYTMVLFHGCSTNISRSCRALNVDSASLWGIAEDEGTEGFRVLGFASVARGVQCFGWGRAPCGGHMSGMGSGAGCKCCAGGLSSPCRRPEHGRRRTSRRTA